MMSKRADQKKSAARVVRQQIEAEKRRKRNFWISIVVLVGLALTGVVGTVIYMNNRAEQVNTPASANSTGNAIVTGSGPVVVEDYVDYLCPHCKDFHEESSAALEQLVAENRITLIQHPVAYLDRASTNRYSTRSSAAAGCAADAGKFNEYSAVLFANQPAEGGPGPTDDQLISLGTQAGLGEDFAQCVRDQRYVTWAKKVSEDAASAGITGTPTVLVNGQKVNGTAGMLAAIGAATQGTPTPSAS